MRRGEAVVSDDDLSALAWVQDELRRSLDTAHKALRRFVKEVDALAGSDVDRVDPAVLRGARMHLHQGLGALELVGLPMPARLLRASEAAVQRLALRPTTLDAAAVATIEKASFALLDYLDRVLAGRPMSPVALFPQYAAVQQLAGAERIHPADLWPLPWRWADLPAETGVPARSADGAARAAMETMVLALMRAPDPPSLERMSDLCAELGAGATGSAATLWQLAAACFEAQAAGLVAGDIHVKRVASRLLAQLRAVVRGQDATPDRLAQDLLFFCAHARSPGPAQRLPRLAAVRAAWALDDSGDGAGVDYDTPRLGRYDPALVLQGRKRVAGAKEIWSAVAGGDLLRLPQLGDPFALLGDTVQRLYPGGGELSRALQEAAAAVALSEALPPPTLAMEVATALLYLEASTADVELDHPELAERVQRLARRIDEARGGLDPRPLESWMEELYRRVSDRQTMGSVVQELRATQSEVEKQIDQYFRDPTQRVLLIPVPAQLSAMRGVLSVLGLDQASQAVLHMRDEVDALAQTEVDPHRAVQAGTFNRLADNLGALSFLIDMLSVQPALAKSLFRFDAEAGSLRAMVDQSERVSAFAAFDLLADAAEPEATVAAVAPDESADEVTQAAPPAPVASVFSAEDQEMRDIFLEEAAEVLAAAREGLAALAEQPADVNAMISVRRAFHTLKGSARMVGLADFGEAAWHCERVYNTRLAGDGRIDDAALAFSGEAVAYLSSWVGSITADADGGHAWPAVVLAVDSLRADQLRVALALPGVPAVEAGGAGAAPPGAALDPSAPADQSALLDVAAEGGELQRPAVGEVVEGPELEEIGADAALDGGPAESAPETIEEFDLSTLLLPVAVLTTPLDFDLLAPPPVVAEGEPASSFELDFESAEDAPQTLPVDATASLAARVPGLPSAADLDLGPLSPPAEEPLPVIELTLRDDFGAPPGMPAPAELELQGLSPGDTAADPAEFDEVSFELDLGELEPQPQAQAPSAAGADSPAQVEPAPTFLVDEAVDFEFDLDLLAAPIADLAEAPFTAAAEAAPETPEVAEPQPTEPVQPLAAEVQTGGEPPSEPTPEAVPETAAAPEAAPEPVREPEPVPVHEPEPVPVPVPVREPELEPEPVPADLEAAAAAGAADLAPMLAGEEDEEPVKVIGPLRIPIPLFNIFLNEADEQSRRLGTELAEWALEQHRAVPDSAVALAHSLAGNSATVGQAELSALARALEHSLQHSRDSGHSAPGDADLFVAAGDEIRRLLHQFAAGFLQSAPTELLRLLAEQERRVDVVEFVAPAAPLPASLALPAMEELDDIDAIDVVDDELFPIFEDEAADLLPQLLARLAEWVRQPAALAAAAAAMRTLHTFKGGARLAGAMRVGEMAHRIEAGVERLTGGSNLQPADIEPLLARADAMATAFDALREAVAAAAAAPPQETPPAAARPQGEAGAAVAPAPDAAAPTPDATAPALDATMVLPPSARPSAPAPAIDWGRFVVAAGVLPARPSPEPVTAVAGVVRVRAALLDRLVNLAGEVSITRSRLETGTRQLQTGLNDLGDNLDRLRRQLRELELQAETQIGARIEAAKVLSQDFDPLEMDRFTRFQELTRFLAESVNDVATVQRGLQRSLQSTEDELAAQARLTRSLQDDLLRTRMVEFESAAERLYRVVRQASKETGRQVRLDIVGGTIEVDRGVLERMIGSFEHLLRNSVVHGIESPQDRQAAGKDPTGSITVTVTHEGNEVGVEFRDDGGGLDLDRIRARAVERGLLAADADADPAWLAQLIFVAGFSTVDDATELAGRGVGMDVVRAEVNAMGGRIETESSVGRGMRLRLLLPLTTAVTQVVMLRAGALSVAVPATLVEIVRRAPTAEVEQAYASGSFRNGDEQLPFFWLGALLESGGRGAGSGGRSEVVVIIRSAAQRVALHVDEVVGNQEVVVKNLGPQLARLPGLAGMTLLPSGVVAPIYHPVALAAVYGEPARLRMQRPSAQAEPAAADALPQAPLVLVVDDSLTVRRVTQRLLQREGYRVVLAKDGLEALERLAVERPAIVLSDIEMPRMDGFDLLRNVRSDSRLGGLPVVMITSRTAQKHRDHALALGADHYLGKPYAEEELLALVARHAGADIHL